MLTRYSIPDKEMSTWLTNGVMNVVNMSENKWDWVRVNESDNDRGELQTVTQHVIPTMEYNF